MVLEALITPWKARRHPFRLFFLGLLFAIASVIFSLWVFPNQASMVMVLLLVMMSVPLMYATLVVEEETEIKIKEEASILKVHAKTIGFLALLFLGFIVGFTLFYVFLPTNVVDVLFSTQHSAIQSVNDNVSGNVLSLGSFFSILGNNLKVLIFCILFAFFFGAGAIFILSWNASVIATAIGHYIREGIASVVGSFGWVNLASYFHIFAFGFLRYLTHGIFEIVGYFIGGIAGGIISVGLVKHGWKSAEFSKVLYDGAVLLIIAVIVLIFAGLVEVSITPLLF